MSVLTNRLVERELRARSRAPVPCATTCAPPPTTDAQLLGDAFEFVYVQFQIVRRRLCALPAPSLIVQKHLCAPPPSRSASPTRSCTRATPGPVRHRQHGRLSSLFRLFIISHPRTHVAPSIVPSFRRIERVPRTQTTAEVIEIPAHRPRTSRARVSRRRQGERDRTSSPRRTPASGAFDDESARPKTK